MIFGWVGAAVSVVGGIIGGNKASKAARKQAEAQNASTERQLAYDTELWEMNIDKIHSDRDFAVKEIETQARNESRVAAFKDATNLQRYNYDLMIRNREQSSLNQQFQRSDDIYNKQLTLNAVTAGAGVRDELRKASEIRTESLFNAQDQYVQSLIAQGKARALGLSGRTARKIGGTTYADYGRKMAQIDEALDASNANSRAIIDEIARDKTTADLAAWAQKMLDPGTLPMPIVPFQTPQAEWLYPREIGEYDYGPRPVAGAYASPSAAANQAWGTAISGIASNLGTSIAGIKL